MPGPEDLVEVALDERPDLLGLEVERVVVARRERVRAEHDPALHLGPEALAARREVVGDEVAALEPDRVAVAHAVVAREVRRRLRRHDDVVRREAVVGVRQRDLLDDRARALQGVDRVADPRLDARLHALHEVLRRQAEALAAEPAPPPRRPRTGARAARPARAPARRWSRARRGRRRRAAGSRRRASPARAARSGRATTRTRRSRTGSRARTSASARRSRRAPPAGGSSRPCPCRSRTARGTRPRPPPSRRCCRPAPCRGPTGC